MAFDKAAIVATGTELVLGFSADTNSRWLASQLLSFGIDTTYIAAAPDDADDLRQLLEFLFGRVDLVISTGGLGPTLDDVNREVFAQLYGVPLVENAEAVERMRRRFAERGREMPESNRVQALILQGAQAFQNDWGTAPGFYMPGNERTRGCHLFALPGPPREMQPMFETNVRALLHELTGNEWHVSEATIHTIGMAESQVAEKTKEQYGRHRDVRFCWLAKGYGVDVRVIARCRTAAEATGLAAEFTKEIYRRLPAQAIYGEGTTTLAEVVGALLVNKRLTVTTAESCTGGLLAKALTDVSGSSAYLGRGFITYSDEAKVDLLGVDIAVIQQHGAVSAEVASQMASQARKLACSDYAVSITGIAGPTGGTEEKPVGLTFICVASPNATVPRKFQFSGDRTANREAAVAAALNELRLELLGQNSTVSD